MDSRLYRAFAQNSAEMPAAVHPAMTSDQLLTEASAVKPNHRAGVNPVRDGGNGNWLDDSGRNISLFESLMRYLGTSGQARPHIWGNPNADPDNPLIGR